MTTDYAPLYATVALLVPVLMVGIYVGRDRVVSSIKWEFRAWPWRLFNRGNRRPFHYLQMVAVTVGWAVGMLAEVIALGGLAEPDRISHSLRTICLIGTGFELGALFAGILLQTLVMLHRTFHQPEDVEVAVKTVRVVSDDLDGKELPDTTAPIRVEVDGTAWNIYLSESNQRKLLSALEPFTKEAERAPRAGAQRASQPRQRTSGATLAQQKEAKDAQRADIQAFAKTKKLKVPGDRGRIAAELLESYYSANPEADRLF